MSQAYYKTKESVTEYIQLAKDVNGSNLIESLAKVLPHAAQVLELGSGPGTDWKLLSKHFSVTGSDNSPEFLDHLNKENPSGTFMELDASTLNVHSTFDGIYSNKVLHHLKDQELMDSIQRQYDILNPQGIICHSFWKGEGSEIFKGLFVNYHSESDLTNLFSPNFKILTLSLYAEFEDADSILLIAQKK